MTCTTLKNIINHKKGDTFRALCTYVEDDGTPIPLEQYTITSQVRTVDDVLVSALVVEPDPLNVGMFTVEGPTDTWPVDVLAWDIQYVFDGEITSTDTKSLRILRDVTHA